MSHDMTYPKIITLGASSRAFQDSDEFVSMKYATDLVDWQAMMAAIDDFGYAYVSFDEAYWRFGLEQDFKVANLPVHFMGSSAFMVRARVGRRFPVINYMSAFHRAIPQFDDANGVTAQLGRFFVRQNPRRVHPHLRYFWRVPAELLESVGDALRTAPDMLSDDPYKDPMGDFTISAVLEFIRSPTSIINAIGGPEKLLQITNNDTAKAVFPG